MPKRSPEPERKAFKDWFDRKAARDLAAQVAASWHGFDEAGFVRDASTGLQKLEFADRIRQFSQSLAKHLPDLVPDALAILTESLPPPMSDCESVSDGWLQWPVGQFIADYGLDHFEESVHAMIELTQRLTSEFAVRPFVEHRPDETFARLQDLVTHESAHVRRWCSEGVRPRLPWGKKLHQLVHDPSPIWPILEALKDDTELYVRRSVANNVNDIAKDHPNEVVSRCQRWSASGNEHVLWTVKHGLRTLIKDGHPGALKCVGFHPPKKITASLTAVPKKVSPGSATVLSATLQTTHQTPQKLAVDYVVHFVRKGGKTNAKVFKWTTLELARGGRVALEKKHPMKETSVRALYPGRHRVELQTNGERVAESFFDFG